MSHTRMIKMPSGEFKEHALCPVRLSADNPREVTIMLPEDVAELSRDERHNHFHFVYVPTDLLPKLKRDAL